MSDGGPDEPQVPPPGTWAGRRPEPEEEPSAPDDGQGSEPSSGPAPGLESGEVGEDLHAEEPGEDLDAGGLEGELDVEELDEEELAGELAAQSGPDASPSHDTVEADTPALADREAAREAALAGLRARTAEHSAKLAAGPPSVAPGAPAAPKAGVPAPSPDEQQQAAQQAPPPGVQAAPAEPEPPERAPRSPLWPRFVAGSLVIMVSMATATAVSLLVYLTDIAEGLGGLGAPVQNQLEVSDPGKPQTILILGSDKRPGGQEIGARSDTTILLRVAAEQITMLSIPRDLKVNIPGHGIDKFNAAYSYGGPKLTLKVVKQLTGITDVNHVVNVDFNGFADAVNAIDCVYVDVDRHYYHSNLGLAAAEQYAEIDVEAGYQRLCGYNALQYVRFRHDDNDLVRAARQQEFLREARQELPGKKLLSDRNRLIDILKRYVTSDIDDPITLVSLGKLFLAARSAPVIQIHFPANLGGPNAAYVTASEQAVRDAVQKFEGEAPPPPTTGPDQQGSSKPTKEGSDKSGGKPEPPPPLIDASSLGQQYAAQLAGEQTKSGKPMVDFPIYYPTKLAPDSTLSDDSRAFPIDGPGNDAYHGYKLVATLPTDGYTAYYGVSGTNWRDPPILANPDETKTIDGRDYLLSWDGDQLRFVGWKTDHGSYWVENTLLKVLTPGQMLGIAESMRKYEG